jgi:hypothetical protein
MPTSRDVDRVFGTHRWNLACAAASTAAFGCLTWPLFCTGAS